MADEKKTRQVGREVLPDGKVVSTVRLAWPLDFDVGGVFTHETMVFPSEGDFSDLACQRYSSEEEAMAGHAKAVREWTHGPDWSRAEGAHDDA